MSPPARAGGLRRRARLRLLALLLAPSLLGLVAFLAWSGSGLAQPLPSASAASAAGPDAAPGEASDAGALVADAAAPPPSPAVAKLRETTVKVRDLVADHLDVATDPASLFDVPIRDEGAVALEARRLTALLLALDEPPVEDDARGLDAGVDAGDGAFVDASDAASRIPPRRPPHPPRAPADAGAVPDAAPADAGSQPALDAGVDGGVAPYAELLDVDPALWDARVDLDRARLSFYLLPPARRAALLASHAERQRRDAEATTKIELSEAARKGEQAAEEQQRALEAARNATDDAQRMVAEEQARLLGVSRTQADFEAALVLARGALREQKEQSETWLRRVHDIVAAEPGRTPEPPIVDRTYRELREFLGASRDALDASLDAWAKSTSDVPDPGPDPLQALPAEVDTHAVRELRARVEAETAVLRKADLEQRAAAAPQLLAGVVDLNRGRLSLLPLLSADMRSAVTGFGAAGRDQAAAELRQATLVVRFRLRELAQWLSSLGTSGSERTQGAIAVGMLALRWVLPILAFVWWRRRGPRLLKAWRERVRDIDRKARVVRKSRLDRALGFVTRVHGPATALLFVQGLMWLMPAELAGKLEFELMSTVLWWTLGSMLIVAVIDGLAGEESSRQLRQSRMQTAHLRLRSIRLVGRVVALVGMVLTLSSHFVGRGTLYAWVFSTCWFAAIPIALLIVRWWRGVIFERMGLRRKKGVFIAWVVRHRTGFMAYPAAVAGAAFLVAHGVNRRVRHWVARFELARRALAYLFRRGLDKMAEEKASLVFEPLPAATYVAMGPDQPSDERVASVADQQVSDVIARIREPGGGVFAVVGERGAGKTTIAERIREGAPDVTVVRCPFGGLDALAEELRRISQAERGAALEELVERLAGTSDDAGVIIDDAHRLIHPSMGGLRDFDRLLALIRRHSHNCTWVAAIDQVIWRFFERSRGARPLFDDVIRLEPWREEGIARLLTHRAKMAGIQPSFTHLVADLGTDADELDQEEAEAQVGAGYYRLLWDYSGGNPGVALHVWRTCLGVEADGRVCAKLFQASDTRDLERLPDAAVFVLRAVVQLERPRSEDVVRATLLPATDVADALRYGVARGYFEFRDGRYHVTWSWFRTITRFLQRRHLLVASS